MFKIKTAFTLLFGFLIVFLLAIFIVMLALYENRKDFGDSQTGRLQSIKISDQIRERNEELTHACLNYIITGDSIWKLKYDEAKSLSSYRFPTKSKGFNLLKDSLKTLGYGRSEYQMLERAIRLATSLNKMEAETIQLIDIDDKQRELNVEEALKIISGTQYLDDKQELMQVISQFEKRIEEQTETYWKKNSLSGKRLFRLVIIFLMAVIAFAIIAFVLILRRIIIHQRQDVLFKKGVERLHKTQKELIKSDERFNLAVRGSGARVWDYQVDEQSLYWFPSELSLMEFEPHEVGTDLNFLLQQMHQDDRIQFNELLDKHINEDIPFNMDARIYSKAGELRWCRCIGNSSRNSDGKSKRVVGIFIDITDRVKAEERATNAILETEDKERSRIARDIHDSLQQTMSTALLNFEKVRSSLKFEDVLLAEKFNTGYLYLKKSIAESRTLAHNLMPKVVDKNGVAVAIESLVYALKGSTSTDLQFYQNMNDERINLAAEMTFYRIVQEALNNVIKYARANECIIQLLKHEGMVTLTIEDDGVGFEIGKMNDTFGLNSMKTRAQAIGAFYQLESAPGRGTQILIELSV